MWHNFHHVSFQGKQTNWRSVLAWFHYGCLKLLKNGTTNFVIWYPIFKIFDFPDSSYDEHEAINKKIIKALINFYFQRNFWRHAFFALNKLLHTTKSVLGQLKTCTQKNNFGLFGILRTNLKGINAILRHFQTFFS